MAQVGSTEKSKPHAKAKSKPVNARLANLHAFKEELKMYGLFSVSFSYRLRRSGCNRRVKSRKRCAHIWRIKWAPIRQPSSAWRHLPTRSASPISTPIRTARISLSATLALVSPSRNLSRCSVNSVRWHRRRYCGRALTRRKCDRSTMASLHI